jgi:hypothetical protein
MQKWGFWRFGWMGLCVSSADSAAWSCRCRSAVFDYLGEWGLLARFNATETLERLRNQRMVFVGDSIGRNHWESMLCMLAEGVASQDKESRIYEINGETISKHTGFLAFRFKDYNLTVEYYREPFLIPQTRPPPHSHPNVTCSLIVDTPCWSFSKWVHADILVFNAGHWWTDQKIRNQYVVTTLSHFCSNTPLPPTLLSLFVCFLELLVFLVPSTRAPPSHSCLSVCEQTWMLACGWPKRK